MEVGRDNARDGVRLSVYQRLGVVLTFVVSGPGPVFWTCKRINELRPPGFPEPRLLIERLLNVIKQYILEIRLYTP